MVDGNLEGGMSVRWMRTAEDVWTVDINAQGTLLSEDVVVDVAAPATSLAAVFDASGTVSLEVDGGTVSKVAGGPASWTVPSWPASQFNLVWFTVLEGSGGFGPGSSEFSQFVFTIGDV